jgi:non-specific serine/threonine protein kinase
MVRRVPRPDKRRAPALPQAVAALEASPQAVRTGTGPGPDSLLALSPSGRLYAPGPLPPPLDAELLARDPARFLLALAAEDGSEHSEPVIAYWRGFARVFLAALCAVPELEERRSAVAGLAVPEGELERFIEEPPPMLGAEYLNRDALDALIAALRAAVEEELAQHAGPVQSFLARFGPSYNVLGRVCFHLAENKADLDAPFAFLATYADRVAAGRARHVPLRHALEAYSAERDKLLLLLAPVQKAAARSETLRALVERGEIFHPLAWTAEEAHAFLKDMPILESSGLVVRVPDWWRTRSRSHPEVRVSIGSEAPVDMGAAAILDFSARLCLDGEPLAAEEIEAILAESASLVLLKGRWVEIDRERLSDVLAHWKTAERAAQEGLSFGEAMRLLAGATLGEGAAEQAAAADHTMSRVIAGPWLAAALERLRSGEESGSPDGLLLPLRGYQKAGLRWLLTLDELGLGGCLADDMGLGKTAQVLALLLEKKRRGAGKSLLVVPASLIANWLAEVARFAPSLATFVAHPSAVPAKQLAQLEAKGLPASDLVITTYGTLHRLPWLREVGWSTVVLDEAQAIKNPGTRQARAAKALRSRTRFALTGTPIENRLGDLWSLFDFLSPGLLGTPQAFKRFLRRIGEKKEHDTYAPLRRLVRPYILRRMKSDRRIVDDLPDKTELASFCTLTRVQAALYAEAVEALRAELSAARGMKRRGAVLASLLRLKQICNHPAQWLGGQAYDAEASGKFKRLGELVEQIRGRQEKVLVFTQFRELCDPLAEHLASLFGRPGLVLHGETAVKKRGELVRAFQDELGPPFFVLSLKAGGTGLNLTRASHVIHFDRWWNPAVENQATDRAYRIGQRRNVLVHKFICRGTIEERIDALIASKRALSSEVLSGDAELLLTELDDAAILQLIALDLDRALEAD